MKASEIAGFVCGINAPFDYRTHICVPNLSHSFVAWEMDLAVLTPAGYLTEVEIKVSKSDLCRDFQKKKWNRPHWAAEHAKLVRAFYYAVPVALAEEALKMPERFGVIEVGGWGPAGQRCKVRRKAETNRAAKPFSEADQLKLMRLAYIRYWSRETELSKMLSRLHLAVAGHLDQSETVTGNLSWPEAALDRAGEP